MPRSVAFLSFEPAPGPATTRSVLADTDPATFEWALACGLLGIEEGLQPGVPEQGNAYKRPFALPGNLSDALDRLERRNGEWRMLVRKCTIEMTADCDASWVFSENVKGFLKARWDGQDPCYDRPYVPNNEGLRW